MVRLPVWLCPRLQEVRSLYAEELTVGEERRRQGEARLGMTWRGKAGQARAKQGRTLQNKTRKGNAMEGKARRDEATPRRSNPILKQATIPSIELQ